MLLTARMNDALRRVRDVAQGMARRGLSGERKARLASVLTSTPLAAPLRIVAGRIPCGECTIDTRFPFVADHTRAEMWWGMYESGERRAIETSLLDDTDIVELGASLGVVSSHLARRLGSGRRLVCVEADARLAASIRKNVANNAPRAKLEVVSAAIAYGADEVALEFGFDTTMGRVGGESSAASVRVPAMSLSALLARHAIDSYALVMDIEGAEAEILARDREALIGCRQILAELHETERDGRHVTQEDLAREIEALGFVRAKQDGFVYVFNRQHAA